MNEKLDEAVRLLEQSIPQIESAYEKLAAENIGLREALKEISELHDVNSDEAMGIARRALRAL